MSRRSQAERDAGILKQYFGTDPKFEFVNLVAHGQYGSAFRVKYKDPNHKLNQFLVKKAFDLEGADDALETERRYLQRLRGAAHIVQMLDIPDNPLDKRSTDPDPSKSGKKLPNIIGDWIILEWLEHGTVGDFIIKARNMGVKRIPNRLLWRFFYCLVRGCIAMAWPPNRHDGTVVNETIPPDVTESKLVHNDVHARNVLLAEPPKDAEHTISPIIKIIDFGIAGEWAWADGRPSAVQSNIRDIGQIMLGLITLTTLLDSPPSGPQDLKFTMVDGGPEIDTDAKGLLPLTGEGAPYPHLDPLLGRLVCACRAFDHNNRPTLRRLNEVVSDAVTNRGEGFYPGVVEEQDDSISKLWRQIVSYTGGGGDLVIEISS
ncbi:kinase-like protein [Hypoxylon sp. FL0543]|nr:kinase-like protein [Hypoxylon sp. FL0543]